MNFPIKVGGGFAADFEQIIIGGAYHGPTLAGDAVTTSRWIRALLGKGPEISLICEIPTDDLGNQLWSVLASETIQTYQQLRPECDSRVAYWDKTADGNTINHDKSNLLESHDSRLGALPNIEIGGTGILALMSSALTRDLHLGWKTLIEKAHADGNIIISSPNTREFKEPNQLEKLAKYQPNLEDQIALSDYVIFSKKDLKFAYPDKTFAEAMLHLLPLGNAGFVITDGENPTEYYAADGLQALGALLPTVTIEVATKFQHLNLKKVGAGGAFVAGFAANLASIRLDSPSMHSPIFSMRESEIYTKDLIVQQYVQLITAGHETAAQHIRVKNKLPLKPGLAVPAFLL